MEIRVVSCDVDSTSRGEREMNEQTNEPYACKSLEQPCTVKVLEGLIDYLVWRLYYGSPEIIIDRVMEYQFAR
jgi:hypothetical protein